MVSAVSDEYTGTCRDQGVKFAEHRSAGCEVAKTQASAEERNVWTVLCETAQIHVREQELKGMGNVIFFHIHSLLCRYSFFFYSVFPLRVWLKHLGDKQLRKRSVLVFPYGLYITSCN